MVLSMQAHPFFNLGFVFQNKYSLRKVHCCLGHRYDGNSRSIRTTNLHIWLMKLMDVQKAKTTFVYSGFHRTSTKGLGVTTQSCSNIHDINSIDGRYKMWQCLNPWQCASA